MKDHYSDKTNTARAGGRASKRAGLAALIMACLLALSACGESYIEGGSQGKSPQETKQSEAESKQGDAEANSPGSGDKSAEGSEAEEAAQDGTGQAEQSGAGEAEAGDDSTVDTEPHSEPVAMYVEAPEGYFESALFIGDSRCEGLRRYGGIEGAEWFTDVGLTVFEADEKELETEDKGTVTLPQILDAGQYDSIYICLGINELGFGTDAISGAFAELISMIEEKQPGAVIYLLANLHVTKERSESDPVFNNENIEQLNTAISLLADFDRVYYLDANPLFDDAEGNMDKEYSFDNTHLYAKHYAAWTEFLRTHAANREGRSL